jgi:hypothetical protein
MTNTPPESEVQPAGADTPRLPPRILDQITQDFLPRRTATPAPSAATTVVEPPPWAERTVDRKGVGRFAWLIALAAIVGAVALGLTVFRSQLSDWLKTKPGLLALAQRLNARSPGGSAADLHPMKPRISFPLPADAAYSSALLPASQADLLTQLSRSLSADLATGTNGLRPLLGKTALSAIDPEHSVTDDDLRGLTDGEKKLVLLYRDMFTELGRALSRTGSRRDDLQALSAQQDRLSRKIEDCRLLAISKLALCRRVAGFGKYEKYLGSEFPAGSLPLILVYAEVAHAKPLSQTDGRFLITVTVEMTLLDDATGGEIWRQDPAPLTDECASQRSDFHIAQDLRLPNTVSPGKYRLRVKITDQSNGAVAVASVPLTISGR